MNTDQYVSTRNNRHTGQAERQWIEYADGVFEPVRKNGNLNRKYHGDKRTLDWWSVDKPLDWTPGAEGKQVSLNHDYGQKESSKGKPQATSDKAATGDQARKAPPTPGTPGKSTISQGAAGLWEHEARERAGINDGKPQGEGSHTDESPEATVKPRSSTQDAAELRSEEKFREPASPAIQFFRGVTKLLQELGLDENDETPQGGDSGLRG